MVRLIALLLALSASAAQEPASLESIAERYFKADTYCEAGQRGLRSEPAHGFSRTPFSGCAHRDGRFKFIEYPGPAQVVSWSDGGKFHRYWEANGQYRVYALDDLAELSLFGYRSGGAPVMQSRLFAWGAVGDPSLRGYRPSSALSTAAHTVFERLDERWPGNSERLWVRKADNAILKYEAARDGAVLRVIELSSQELDRPLRDEELSHRVPPLARVSLQNNPAAFFAGLLLGALLAGAAFWAWLFTRSPTLDAVLRKRRLLWKAQLWGAGVIAILLAVLAALALATPDSGHPPFIVVVIVAAIWCGIAFALTASFTLTSYVVQRLVRPAR